MAVFGPTNREELLIGASVSAETSIQDFIDKAKNTDLGIYSADGSAAASNKKFYVLQKTNGESGEYKNLNYEFSDKVFPSQLDQIILKAYSPEVQKKVKVNGFTTTPLTNATYEVLVRLYRDGGSLSPENFRIIGGYFVTGNQAPTNKEIINGIIKNLELSQAKEGDTLFTFANDNDTALTVEGKYQKGDPAKNIADQIEFDVQVSVKSNGSDVGGSQYISYDILSTEVLATNNPGSGTGKQVANLEWFTKGYAYEVYRETAYPVNFNTPYYANYDGAYNIINILYHRKNSVSGVEEQPRVLTIAVVVDPNDVGTNAATNAVLAKLRTVVGSGNVPADLPTS